jgi:plastocyanin
MTGKSEPGAYARRSLLRRALGGGVAVLIGARAGKAAAAEMTVTIDNFSFSPTPVIVMAGSKVTWVNQDDTIHSIVCPKLKVKSQPLDTDDRFSYQFDQAGTYDYVCGLHPHMRGQVIVM